MVWSLLKAISSFLFSPWIDDADGIVVHTDTVRNSNFTATLNLHRQWK
jgi:hypothetical protein